MLHVVTAQEMRELDRKTIEDIGLPGEVLMETAGRRLAGAVLELEHIEPVAVICAGGNNGGDGFVCARVLREHGVNATVYLTAEPGAISGHAAVHASAYRECGGVVISIADAAGLEDAEEAIGRSAVVVDALLGTGLARPVTGHLADVIEIINEATGVVIACDVPSGLDADTGIAAGACVRADITVTMAFAKRGLVLEPGFTYAGDLHVVEIGIPSAFGSISTVGFFEREDATDRVPWPLPTDYKNRRGSVLVLAGSPGRRGAARLSARAALRSGAGLVTWASPSATELTAQDPLMTLAVDPRVEIGSWLPAALDSASAVVIGPGMATDEWGNALVTATLASTSVPVIIDADGLNHLATDTSRLERRIGETVLTPHLGEAARLLGDSSAVLRADRLRAAERLAELGAVAVLKGARTIVADGELSTINGSGNAGMATAGSGDVLAGIIGGLLAQGMGAGDAARLGVHVHGLCGDLAADELGVHAMTADDLIATLGDAFGELE